MPGALLHCEVVWRRAIIIVLCLVGSLGAWMEAKARAQVKSAPRARVLLVLDTNIASASGFSEALTAQLADLDVEITSGSAQGEVPAAALALARAHQGPRDRGVVWVAKLDADILIFVVEPAADKTLLRSLPNADPAQFATQETVAVIVRSSIEGLLSGAPIGFVAPSVAQPDATPPVAVTSAPRPSRFMPELNVGYVGASFATQIPWQHGVRLAVGMSHLFFDRGYAQFAVSLLRDERVSAQGVSLRLTRTPIEAVMGYRFQHGAFAFAPELSAALELSSRDAQATTRDVEVVAADKRLSALLGGHLWLMRALGGHSARTWLAVGGGVEAVLNNVDYRVETRRGSEPASRAILLSPRSFRPIARIALQVTL